MICGGWVPFLKELAKHSQIAHKGSLDIDVLLRAKARERESVDRVKNLPSEPPAFQPSKADAFRYEKSIDCNVVQLDLLADLPRRREDESVLKIQGATSGLQVCLVDAAENLGNHVETIQINCREGETLETFEIAVPDAVGFLILKTTVTRFREKKGHRRHLLLLPLLTGCGHNPANAREFDSGARRRANCGGPQEDVHARRLKVGGDGTG